MPAPRPPHDLRVATVRRAVDLLLAALVLAVVAPACLLVAAAILLEDGGAVIFTQTRVGRGGRPFRILKFRTMTPDVVGHTASGSPLR
jgi:lipopolysaccharide/colanic/teichoic acid biosynthesis glycosyltransferase